MIISPADNLIAQHSKEHHSSTNKLSRWIAALILLFVFTQAAGLIHAEIHPFHEHEASCDVFDNLAQPINHDSNVSFEFVKVPFVIPTGLALRSVFDAQYIPHFMGRAPPVLN
ncbi:hypothetical protein [Thiomicrorhabdus sp. Kp2]|uniref:hypothetical protein n=1 Tax=Thiomicrorhabdus sp. Kp2 TaxID=1123518 RepID=UPI000593B7FA|nr:hypothetical protein [Thiomicrorhabdus sp. Kp2]